MKGRKKQSKIVIIQSVSPSIDRHPLQTSLDFKHKQKCRCTYANICIALQRKRNESDTVHFEKHPSVLKKKPLKEKIIEQFFISPIDIIRNVFFLSNVNDCKILNLIPFFFTWKVHHLKFNLLDIQIWKIIVNVNICRIFFIFNILRSKYCILL